jgi:hypothetical protein
MLCIPFGLTGGLRPKPGLFPSRDKTFRLKLLVLDYLLYFDTAKLPAHKLQTRPISTAMSRDAPSLCSPGARGELQMAFMGVNLEPSVVRRTGDEMGIAVS